MSDAPQLSMREALAKTLPIHFIRTVDAEGEACFFVLRASTANYNKLMAKRKKERVSMSAFGEVLASGFGRPSAELRARMKLEYGVDLPE
jgi:hypothetical protein